MNKCDRYTSVLMFSVSKINLVNFIRRKNYIDIMGISRVTRNFQLTIPKDVREIHNVKIGDKIIFSINGSKVEIAKLNRDSLEDSFGAWKGKVEPGTNYTKKIRSEWRIRSEKLDV